MILRRHKILKKKKSNKEENKKLEESVDQHCTNDSIGLENNENITSKKIKFVSDILTH